jgi:hypothetical protein
MQWYVHLMTASAAVLCCRSLLILFGRPVRVLIDVRRVVLAQLLAYQNIALPKPRESAVTSRQIREYDEDVRKLREAERVFRDLGSQLLSFREIEPTLCAVLRLFGLDIVAAGSRLNDLAQTYSRPGSERADLQHEVENALRAAAPTRSRRQSQSSHLLNYQHRFLQLRDVGFTV